MTRTRWRTMAGILALSLGGFVVLANDKPKVQSAEKPDCPSCPIPCCQQCPWAQCPAKTEEPCCPPVECPCQKPDTDTSPVPCQAPIPAPIVVIPDVPKPAIDVPPIVRPVAATTTVATVPYRVRMEMVGAITQIELVRGDEVALRVQCDRADVQMPSGGVQAVGRVCLSAPGIDIRCNRMLIGWQAGEISMEGQVRILCQTGQQRTEMSAESVNCRLNSMGTGLEFRASEVGAAPHD